MWPECNLSAREVEHKNQEIVTKRFVNSVFTSRESDPKFYL